MSRDEESPLSEPWRQPRAFVGTLRAILFGLLLVQLAFVGVALLFAPPDGGFGSSTPQRTRLYFWIFMFLSGSFALAWRNIGDTPPRQEMVVSIDAPKQVAKRIAVLFVHTFGRSVLVEILGLLGTVFYLLTAEIYFLAAPLIAVAIILALIPRESQVRELLRDRSEGTGDPAPAIEP